MSKRNGNVLVIVLSVLFVIAVSAAGYFYWKNQQTPSNTNPTQITPTTSKTPTSVSKENNPPSRENKNGYVGYVKGVVLVTFNNGTTYKQAKDFSESLGYDIEGKNISWNVNNFKPNDSTLLTNVDLFKINVPEGKENEVISEFLKSSLVKAAAKDSIIEIPDCSKGPC